MTNPLTPLNDALSIVEDSFRVALACADAGKADEEKAALVAGTKFSPPDVDWAEVQIGVTKLELEDLFVLAMTSCFEARVKEFVKSQTSIAVGEYRAEIEKWLYGEIESAPLYGLAKIFKPPVTPMMIKDIESIRKYRNWVAHGRAYPGPAIAVTPSFAYNTLTTFMTTANII